MSSHLDDITLVNGQQFILPLKDDLSRISWIELINNSSMTLAVQAGGYQFKIAPNYGYPVPVGRLASFGLPVSITPNYVGVAPTNPGPTLLQTTVYNPGEQPVQQLPYQLGTVQVSNAVSTSTTVSQQLVYDTSPINGETANSVKSSAAAGAAPGEVDVTDVNATGGTWTRQMATGSMVTNADGSVTAPAFHGPADSAKSVPAADVQPGTFGAGDYFTEAGYGFHIGGELYGNNGTLTVGDNLALAAGKTLNATVDTATTAKQLSDNNSGNSQTLTSYQFGWAFHGDIQFTQGGHTRGISTFSGNGSGTYSHGLSFQPSTVVVNTNNGANSTTYGSGSYSASSVYIYQYNAQPWVAMANSGY